jgi:hypothetical protein
MSNKAASVKRGLRKRSSSPNKKSDTAETTVIQPDEEKTINRLE